MGDLLTIYFLAGGFIALINYIPKSIKTIGLPEKQRKHLIKCGYQEVTIECK